MNTSNNPLAALRHHVTGAIERGEKTAIRGAGVMQPTAHEKSEWQRLAAAAFAMRRNDIGFRYSVAATLNEMELWRFDALQTGYRGWLVFGEWPETASRANGFATSFIAEGSR